ncbi:MAG: YdcF family protein [Acidobacteria bacterium]|nr:YdcF family protein [Acidobacteriota bacterium]
MKKLILLGLLVAALANPWVLAWIARQYVVADDLEAADVAVPLRGTPEEERLRVEEAAKLVREGFASWLLVSADSRPFYGQPMRKLVEDYLVSQQFPLGKLRFCENTADNTAEEARALRSCLKGLDAERAIIITSEYHTRRTRFLFRRIFTGSGVQVSIRPVYNPRYWNPRWWRQRRWTKTFVIETLSLIWNAVEQWSASPLGTSIQASGPPPSDSSR